MVRFGTVRFGTNRTEPKIDVDLLKIFKRKSFDKIFFFKSSKGFPKKISEDLPKNEIL